MLPLRGVARVCSGVTRGPAALEMDGAPRGPMPWRCPSGLTPQSARKAHEARSWAHLQGGARHSFPARRSVQSPPRPSRARTAASQPRCLRAQESLCACSASDSCGDQSVALRSDPLSVCRCQRACMAASPEELARVVAWN